MTDYAVTLTSIAIGTAAQDLFELTAAANTRVLLKGIRLGQHSDAGDAQDEQVSVTVIRGHTTPGAAGTAVTPVNLNASSDLLASSTVDRNNTTIASGGAPLTLIADSWPVLVGWSWIADEDGPEYVSIEPGQILVVRLGTTGDALTTNATLFFEEIGKMPVS